MRRYYYQKGAIIYGLQNDKEVSKAMEILSREDEYNGMLNGTVLTHAGDKR
jgi:carboxyl-terminal processing protease